ncbi:MAG: NlpC/P60 family protein [Flavobacteriales bacterium]
MSEKIKWIEPQQRYAFCALAVIPVRTEPKDSAEQCTQLLFGEPIEITEYQQPWLKIRSFLDGYEGYIDHKQVFALSEKEVRRWLDTSTYQTAKTLVITGPMGLQLLSRGSLIGLEPSFHIGAYPYNLEALSFADATREIYPQHAWAYAADFLNTPYLWGGKSIFGIDCSGFVQQVFRQLDLNLPRDAYQQAEHGTIVKYEERQELDLAFFKNAAGRIHHVGIIGPGQQIIHASGQVRYDVLMAEGIFNEAAGNFTHSLFEIRRLF